ncbi:hypothetical protein D9757_001299 [Collybiopsis confluens]|uniref:Uncharacterized protein n=1 Tax=Collybiopsis confluens TaxID=2823264 RepID=A0A8H5I1B1_9AGAR|nr:hypothetical protein D9757_001299 [Collybiopsis confluens]
MVDTTQPKTAPYKFYPQKMSLFMFYERWLDIGFSSRFLLPFPTIKEYSTRPSTTRCLSSWEAPLANSVLHDLASENENSSEVAAAATLCVQESYDMFPVDLHEAEVEQQDAMGFSEDESNSDESAFSTKMHEDESEFDASMDDETLRCLNARRDTLVLDSTTPWLTPHIAITLASDTLTDFAVAWFNQPNYPDVEKLCLPPVEFSENLPPPSSHPTWTSPCSPPYPSRVFSPSKFNAMTLLASRASIAYRARYDVALPFADIDRPFSWSDPAEPILLTNRMYRATLIINSPNPFRVPHIIINQPPPENPSNVVNNPQDYGYGRYLVIQTHGISYINEPEDAMSEYPLNLDDYETEDFGTEQEEDYGESYHSTLESYRIFDEVPELDTDGLSSLESPFLDTPVTPEAEDFKAKFERALDKRAVSISRSSPLGSPLESCSSLHPDGWLESPTLSEDDSLDDLTYSPVDEELSDKSDPIGYSSWADEDEDLPSLDDEWYQTVIRRRQPDWHYNS